MRDNNLNIAIFGGSFDPVHIGHEKIVQKVLDTLDLDKLIVVPTYLNPFKEKYHLNPKIRYELLELLFEENSQVEISDFEILQEKPIPSIKTIEYFKNKYNPKKIFLIIGADNLKQLHTWKNFDKLNSLVTFVVISREGYEVKNDIIQFISIKLDIHISSTELRENLNLDFIPKKIEQKVKEIWKQE